jgi:hypothetical protein
MLARRMVAVEGPSMDMPAGLVVDWPPAALRRASLEACRPGKGSLRHSAHNDEIAAASESFDSTGSRNGLSSKSSSVMYPAVVPSENIRINPSSPSRSTFSIRICSAIGRVYTITRLANCLVLLTLPMSPWGKAIY